MNSRPPPISKPHGINTVGRNSPYIFFPLPPVIPTVIPLFLDASLAASVESDVYSFSAPYTNMLLLLAINLPSYLANFSVSLE